MGLNIGGEVEKINGNELSYRQFVERYLEKNQPVVLTGLTDGWRASKDWVTADGAPNLCFFSAHFGKSRAQIAKCDKREFTDQARVEMTVSDFTEHWQESFVGKNLSRNVHHGAQSLLYLKDWHFVKEYPHYDAYTTPLFFVDDWLNLYLDVHPIHVDTECHEQDKINCSDYRFVYMGAKGTWTPLHADVFRSYSWSANVCGKKKWHLLSPSQCHLLFDVNMKNLVYDIFENVSSVKFPGFKKTIWLECNQEKNEIVFVPSGWYHQVLNMEDTISINHNWFNAYNLSWLWKLLLKDYEEASEYIDDIRDICEDFEGLCQRNLAANTGMNFIDFFVFISWFSLANLTILCDLLTKHGEPSMEVSSDNATQLMRNIASLRTVACNMTLSTAFAGEKLRSRLESFSDVKGIFEKPEFTELCAALNRTYGMIDEQSKPDSSVVSTPIAAKPSVLCSDFIAAVCPKLSGPEDLIKIIDAATENFICKEKTSSFSLFNVTDDSLSSPVI